MAINKKNIILILSSILLLFIFTSCSKTSDANQNGYDLSSFNGGDDAIVFNFVDSLTPKTVLDNSTQLFNIALTIENKGECDIPENSSYVTLNGFKPEDLGLNLTSKTLIPLRKVRKVGTKIIPGGRTQVIFNNLKYINSIIAGPYPLTIYANICYPYKTFTMGSICIKGDINPTENSNSKICDVIGDKKYANSGAPVKIENLKEYVNGRNSVQIMFDIVHTPTSNDANVYESGSIDSNCNINGVSASNADSNIKKDKVRYQVNTGIEGLNCEGTNSNTNMVTLTNNRHIVTCIQDTTGQTEYEKPISITLDYDYLDRKPITINVEHIAN